MNERSLAEAIRKAVLKETIFLRHYIGQVLKNEDPKSKGRVKVSILDLGLDDEDKAIWCFPRDKNSISVPALNDWVEVYFINGNREMPVYLGLATEIKEMLPAQFDGNPKNHILFEDPVDKEQYLKYNEDDKLFSLYMNMIKVNEDQIVINKEEGTISFLGGGDRAVRFSELEAAFDELKGDLNDFVTAYNAHIHTTTATIGTGPVGVISPTTSTATASAADVSGAEIEEIEVP